MSNKVNTGMFSVKVFGRATLFLVLMSAITTLYTLLITVAGQAVFPAQAGGSLIEAGGRRYSAFWASRSARRPSVGPPHDA